MLDRVELEYRPYEPKEIPTSNPKFAGFIDNDLSFNGIDLREIKKTGNKVVALELSESPQSVSKSNLEKLRNKSTVMTIFYQESVITSVPKIDLIATYRNKNGIVESRNLSERDSKWWSRLRGWFENKFKFFKPR